MRKRLRKKKYKQIAEEFERWYVNEFKPLIKKKQKEFEAKI